VEGLGLVEGGDLGEVSWGEEGVVGPGEAKISLTKKETFGKKIFRSSMGSRHEKEAE